MNSKIIIVGKNSFIANHLFIFLKKKNINVKLIEFSKFKQVNYKNVKFLINCSIDPNYLKKYNESFDRDLTIAKYVKNFSVNYFFLSSGKVYGHYNKMISERYRCRPKSRYAKNKFTTEKKLLKILKQKLIIFRISNIIGLNLKEDKKIKTFFNTMILSLIKSNIIKVPRKNYLKDFVTINDFVKIIYKSIVIKLPFGIYNLSSGIGLNIRTIAYKMIKGYKTGKVSLVQDSTDNYILNPKKLFNEIKFNINRVSLMNSIYSLGKTL